MTQIDIVQGEDIRYWYNERNHHPDLTEGGLHWSSMKFQHMQPFFNLYTNNKTISLIIATTWVGRREYLLGRALLWTTEDGRLIMDNIYADGKTAWEIMKSAVLWKCEWAPFVEEKVKIRLEKALFETYPYVDTFSYLTKDEKGWYLTNIPSVFDFPTIKLSSHKGLAFYSPIPPKLKGVLRANI